MIDQDNDLRPWVPEGAREFREGDRVRVRLSGECRARFTGIRGDTWGHSAIEDGAVGIVGIDPFFRNPTTPSHAIKVLFDPPLIDWPNWVRLHGMGYAPSELELLEAAQ